MKTRFTFFSPFQSAVWAFRSVSSLEKTAESIKIEILPRDYKVFVEVRCKYSVIKSYTLNFLECESLKVINQLRPTDFEIMFGRKRIRFMFLPI